MVSSCEKENIENKNQTRKKRELNSLKSTSSSEYSFDIYGDSHNSAMDYVASHPNFDSLSKEQMFNYLQTFDDGNFNFENTHTYSEHLNGMLYTNQLLTDLSNAGQKLYNDGFIEEDMVNLAQDFFDVFNNAAPVVDNGSNPMSVAAFKDNMNSFEATLLSNYNVQYDAETKTGNFPALLLAASSVAKSSYEYWSNVEGDPNHPWGDQHARRGGHSGHTNGGWFSRAWHSIKVAAVDAYGFVSCEECKGGNADGTVTTYNLNEAWRYAGQQSNAY